MARQRILIVEDAPKTAASIDLYLRHAGFATEVVHDGRLGLERARAAPPDLVILDLMLPRLDGLQICRALRAESAIPILILTARAEEPDRVRGLELGADDYLVKPFSPRELVARVRAVLRRAAPPDEAGPVELRFRGLVIDRRRHEVRVDGGLVSLTPTEFRILETLALSPERVFTRDQLLQKAFPPGSQILDRTVDAHVMKLRSKIETDRSSPRLVVTVFGVGYKFTGERDGT